MCWECYAGEDPYPALDSVSLAVAVRDYSLRLPVHKLKVAEGIKKQITRCQAEAPAERPTFKELGEFLTNFNTSGGSPQFQELKNQLKNLEEQLKKSDTERAFLQKTVEAMRFQEEKLTSSYEEALKKLTELQRRESTAFQKQAAEAELTKGIPNNYCCNIPFKELKSVESPGEPFWSYVHLMFFKEKHRKGTVHKTIAFLSPKARPEFSETKEKEPPKAKVMKWLRDMDVMVKQFNLHTETDKTKNAEQTAQFYQDIQVLRSLHFHLSRKTFLSSSSLVILDIQVCALCMDFAEARTC